MAHFRKSIALCVGIVYVLQGSVLLYSTPNTWYYIEGGTFYSTINTPCMSTAVELYSYTVPWVRIFVPVAVYIQQYYCNSVISRLSGVHPSCIARRIAGECVSR